MKAVYYLRNSGQCDCPALSCTELRDTTTKSEVRKIFELQGLIDHYENILASVGY